MQNKQKAEQGQDDYDEEEEDANQLANETEDEHLGHVYFFIHSFHLSTS